MIDSFFGPLLGTSLSPFRLPVGAGAKKFARERAFAFGEVGKIFDGGISEALVDETKIYGEDGLLANVTALDASGASGENPIIAVCNEVGGVADDASGHWVPYGFCKALVEADTTSITIGRVLRLDLSTPEHCFVLDETDGRTAGYGYVMEAKASTTSGNKYLLDVWFSPIPFIAYRPAP